MKTLNNAKPDTPRISYSVIRREYQHHSLEGMVFVDPYATLLSPFFTMLSLRLGLIPNVITLCMIASGVAGAVLFALPFLWAKILGTALIHLWYVLDCSDGEVARITRRFSKFGTEIDFTAHVINHPLFLFAFLLSMLQSDAPWGQLPLCLMFFGLLALNMILRNRAAFEQIYQIKLPPDPAAAAPAANRLKAWVVFFINFWVQLPNFCLIFPLVYFISIPAAEWYLAAVLAANLVIAPKMMISWLRRIVHQ